MEHLWHICFLHLKGPQCNVLSPLLNWRIFSGYDKSHVRICYCLITILVLRTHSGMSRAHWKILEVFNERMIIQFCTWYRQMHCVEQRSDQQLLSVLSIYEISLACHCCWLSQTYWRFFMPGQKSPNLYLLGRGMLRLHNTKPTMMLI